MILKEDYGPIWETQNTKTLMKISRSLSSRFQNNNNSSNYHHHILLASYKDPTRNKETEISKASTNYQHCQYVH